MNKKDEPLIDKIPTLRWEDKILAVIIIVSAVGLTNLAVELFKLYRG